MDYTIGAHATFKTLFKMTIFPIGLMVFISLYASVDGMFVANFCGASAFAGLNLIWPFVGMVGSFGFMVGTGGTALCSKLMGEKKGEEANSIFTLLLVATLVVGTVLSTIGVFLIEPIARAMASIAKNATEEMIQEAITYGRILMAGQPIAMMQYISHPFLSAAGKTRLAFFSTLAGGLTNIAMDALLMAALKLGIAGAALGTIAGYIASIIAPAICFITKKNWQLHLGPIIWRPRAIGQSLYNGMSEFITNISASIVATFYNFQLLKFYGQDGVSAYGVIMYVSFVFAAIFIGYTMGVSPMISYQFGAKNNKELSNLLKKSLIIVACVGVVMFGLGVALANPFARIFSSGVESLEELSSTGLRIYSVAFLICGFSIFSSGFFTALNNGLISGIISILRALVFQVAFVLLLPLLFGPIGIWWSIVAGEVVSIALSVIFLLTKRKKYGY